MKRVDVRIQDLVTSTELSRTGSARQFEDRLRASIAQVGLAEPLKATRLTSGKYLVIDGTMRLQAMKAIREKDPRAFRVVPVYVFEYSQRFEVRYQTDIYQDLLPSQLATLVEHLHKAERVAKLDIARYIGVSAPTVRNYTGLWRLMQRGGLFARIVEMMDAGVLPSSNPYAWLRLRPEGLAYVIERRLAASADPNVWINETVAAAKRGDVVRIPIKTVETVTSGLTPRFYREGEMARSVKRDLGLRRSKQSGGSRSESSLEALTNLTQVADRTTQPILRAAADSLKAYLQ